MQGHLPRLQYQINRLALIHRDIQFLATTEKILRRKCIAMAQLSPAMAARHNTHTAVFPVTGRQGDPSGDDIGRRQAPIG